MRCATCLFLAIMALSGGTSCRAGEASIDWSRVEFFCPWGYGVEGTVPPELSSFPYGASTAEQEWMQSWNAASPAGKAYLLLGAKYRHRDVYAKLKDSLPKEKDALVVAVRYGCWTRKWTFAALAAAVDELAYDWTGTPANWPRMSLQEEGAVWPGQRMVPKP